MEFVPIIVAGLSLLGSIAMALVTWGARSEFGMLRAEMNTLKAEMRASIAEAANEFYRQVNGTYVKKEVYNTLVGRVDGIEVRVNDLGD